jgi:membrane associated rhomboid family serine protease
MPGKSARPWATGAIAALTVLAYAWTATRADADYDRILGAMALRADVPRAAPFLTSILLHASFLHLAFNLVLLGVFGPAVEARIHAVGLCFAYAIAGAAGGLAHVVLAPAALRTAALIGASGAVSGVVGAHAALFPEKKGMLGLAVVWGLANLAGLLVLDRAGSRGLSYAAHLGGLLAGGAFALVVGSLIRSPRR